jgi:hypothetical protein
VTVDAHAAGRDRGGGLGAPLEVAAFVQEHVDALLGLAA